MRDRNLPYKQFNIQLEKYILSNLRRKEDRRITFSQDLSLEFRPYSNHREFQIIFPRNFRLLRALAIVQWYFPENLHFLTYLSLEEQTFNWLTQKQKIEIKIYLSSKENCVKYLYLTDRYSSNEIFGNILKNDLLDLQRQFKIKKKIYPKPTEKVYRRGPKDKGSRRVDSSLRILQEEIEKDFILQYEENLLIKKRKLLHATINKILIILRDFQDLEDK
jgi:hypothetical protein